jgi:hypothetical protein
LWVDELDHINRKKWDNKIENLREATRTQNSYNKDRNVLRGATKVGNKWMAQIGINGVNTYLGLFSTKEEAAAAYEAKAKELHGKFYVEA